MKIPIRNIYYLLSYAWDALPQDGQAPVAVDDAATTADLLAHLLIGGITHLLKRGMMRDYRTTQGQVAGLRGKLLLSETLRERQQRSGRTVCAYDELSGDVLPNQIIKATLANLAQVTAIDGALRRQLGGLRRHLGDVSDIRITATVFGRVQLHRHIAAYKLLLSVCQLVHAELMPDPDGHQTMFRDFVQDDNRMAVLFQRFLFNFYRREQQRFVVDAPQLRWRAQANTVADEAFLPAMYTDVVLRGANRCVILDAKYYRESFQSRFGRDKIRSEHLYQILSYLQNFGTPAGATMEGMLLYPTVHQDFDLQYVILGFPVRVCSIDLDQPWTAIRDRLLAIVGPTSVAE